jgi:hypothetical protein
MNNRNCYLASIFLILSILFVFSCTASDNVKKDAVIEKKEDVAQENTIIEDMIFDEQEYVNFIKTYQKEDEGVLINIVKNSKMSGYDVEGRKKIVEKRFGDNNSDVDLYYIGAEYRGDGIFWIYNKGKKETILETQIRYGPRIIWHGKYTAEIKKPEGSPFTHSYYFNFLDNELSKPYDFPLYYDIENNVVLTWGNVDFELYDLKTNELLQEFSFRRKINMTPAWPYIKYYIKKQNNKILLFYNDGENKKKGHFIININENAGKTVVDKEEYMGNKYYKNNGEYKIFFRNWAVVCSKYKAKEIL